VRNATTISRLRVADDITELVGETPMLQFTRLVPAGAADVFAKLEYLNPGGSVKDRAAIGIIKRAEAEGKLRPGGTIVEATAGNTGIGLALIGVKRGYKVSLFVPEKFSEEKVMIMRALGAEVVRTPEDEGMSGAISRANEQVASTPGAFMAGQFENPANPDYHYETTAREIFEQMEGQIDAIAIDEEAFREAKGNVDHGDDRVGIPSFGHAHLHHSSSLRSAALRARHERKLTREGIESFPPNHLTH